MSGIWRALFFFGLWLLGLAIAGAAQADYDPSDDLMNLFGAHCDSYRGPLVTLASAQAGSLKSVITQMAGDKDCSGVLGALNQISAIDLNQITLSARTGAATQRLRDQSHDIELALSQELAKSAEEQAADATYIADLKKGLSDARLGLLKAKSSPAEIAMDNKSQVFDAVQSAAGNLFDNLASAPGCAKKHPNIGAQFGGQLVSASSFLAGGLLAPVLLASGSVIEKYIDYLQKAPYRRNLAALTKTRMKTALGCGLEGIASTYCQGRDLERVTRANAAGQVAPNCPTNPNDSEGVNLIGTDLPAFSAWINRVVAGSAAGDPYQAAAKKDARDLLSRSLKMGDDFGASILKATTDLGQPGANSNEVLEGLVQQLADFSSKTYDSLTSASFRNDPQCGSYVWFYSGGTRSACNTVGSERTGLTCKQCLAHDLGINPNAMAPPTVAQLQDAADRLLAEGTKRAALGASSSIENKPSAVLAMFSTNRVNDQTAEDFLKGSQTYLGHLLQKEPFNTPGRAQDLVVNLQKRIDCTFHAMKKEPLPADCFPRVPSATPSGVSAVDPEHALSGTHTKHHPIADASPDTSPEAQDKRAQEDVTKVSQLLAPSKDLFYISDSLYQLVLGDLDQRRRDPAHFDQDLSAILQLSSSDSLAELLNSYGGPDSLHAQAIAAKDSTTQTLSTYGSLFSEPITGSIHDMKISHSELLPLACAQALLVPGAPKVGATLDKKTGDWKGGIDITADCAGTHWDSYYPGLSLNFDEWSKKPDNQRICSVYDFYRRSKLEEMKRKRPASNPSTQPSPQPSPQPSLQPSGAP